MSDKQNQFWFSAKHAARTAPHRCFVTVDGVEHEYTEWATDGKEPVTKENFAEDIVLVSEADKGEYRIRVVNPRCDWITEGWKHER